MTRSVGRRTLIGGGGAALALALASGADAHTLYGQWVRYRQQHLLLGCHRGDPGAFDVAMSLEALFAAELPEASLRVARAPFAGRIASLLATDQMKLALLRPQEVRGMAAGDGSFAAYGPVDLALLAAVSGRLLVCRTDMPGRHAWLLRATLVEAALPAPAEAGLALALHPGADAHDAGIGLDLLPG